MKKKILFTIILIFSAHFINAQEIDSIRYQNILKNLKLSASNVKIELVTEKKMPNEENRYIVVIPNFVAQYSDYDFTVKNYILITDEKGNIHNQYVDDNEWTSDAIALTSFEIDTAPYRLNPETRAFIIRAHYRGMSKSNPYSSEEISMYYPIKKTLKRVLNNYNLSLSRGEWDTRCNGEFEDQSSVILVEKEKSNDFANLKIKTETIYSKSKEVKGDCKSQDTKKTTYKLLKFNKVIYK